MTSVDRLRVLPCPVLRGLGSCGSGAYTQITPSSPIKYPFLSSVLRLFIFIAANAEGGVIKAPMQSRRHPEPSIATTGLALLPFAMRSLSVAALQPSTITGALIAPFRLDGNEDERWGTDRRNGYFCGRGGVTCNMPRSCNFQDHVGPDGFGSPHRWSTLVKSDLNL